MTALLEEISLFFGGASVSYSNYKCYCHKAKPAVIVEVLVQVVNCFALKISFICYFRQ